MKAIIVNVLIFCCCFACTYSISVNFFLVWGRLIILYHQRLKQPISLWDKLPNENEIFSENTTARGMKTEPGNYSNTFC